MGATCWTCGRVLRVVVRRGPCGLEYCAACAPEGAGLAAGYGVRRPAPGRGGSGEWRVASGGQGNGERVKRRRVRESVPRPPLSAAHKEKLRVKQLAFRARQRAAAEAMNDVAAPGWELQTTNDTNHTN